MKGWGLAAAAAALLFGGCTTSIAAEPTDVPGFKKPKGFWKLFHEVNDAIAPSDIDADEFKANICATPIKSGYQVTLVASAKDGSMQLSVKADDDNSPKGAVRVTSCDLAAISAAIKVCNYRMLNRNAVQKLATYGLADVAAAAGTAAAIATVADADKDTVSKVSTGAAGFVGLLNGLQRTVPAPFSAQETSMIVSGLMYVAIDPDWGMQLQTPASTSPKGRYGHIFNAAFTSCPLNDH